jgi:hypothetical protein
MSQPPGPVVLDTLTPAERLAFVLHDMFAVPFDEIAPIVDRSPRRRASSRAAPAAASRARTRSLTPTSTPSARSSTPSSRPREGDFEALLEVLDPDVVRGVDRGAVSIGTSRVVRGAANVARQGLAFSRFDIEVRPALVNGAVGTVTLQEGRPFAIAGLTIRNRRIVEMDVIADPELPQPARPDNPRLTGAISSIASRSLRPLRRVEGRRLRRGDGR